MNKQDLIKNLMGFGFVEIDCGKFQYRMFNVDIYNNILYDQSSVIFFKDYSDLWNYFIVNY